MKRVCSVLMICALLMAGLTTFVGAEGTVPSLAITVDQTAVEIGDTVTATVKALDYTGEAWSAMTVKVTYDPAYLSFDKDSGVISNAALEEIQTVVADVKNGEGIIFINWISSDGVPAVDSYDDDYLVKLKFTALAETTTPVKIQSSFVADGIAAQGFTTPVDNANGTVFNPAVQETPEVTVMPVVSVDNSTITEPNGSRKGDVIATYVNGQKDECYLVDLEWGALAFTYTDAKTTWNGESYEWVPVEGEGAVPAVWTVDDENGDKITVTNHSSQPVDIKITSDKAEEGNNPRVTVDNGEFTLEVASTGSKAVYKTATVKVGGTLSPDHVDNDPIASITVTVN